MAAAFLVINMKIDEIKIKIINDSRGDKTLEVGLISDGQEASASVPSGKSTGRAEAAVLSPEQALSKVSWTLSQIKDHQFVSLEQFDSLIIALDGTPNKSNLGGNLMLGLSMAFVRLLASSANLELFELLAKISGTKEKSLPFCFFNLIEGGVHAENSLPFQEYLLVPQTHSPKESLKTINRAIKLLEEKIQKTYGQVKQGDEGGYSIPSSDPVTGFKILQELIEQNNLESKIALDVAASTMVQGNEYQVGSRIMSRQQMLKLYKDMADQFSVLSMEDVFNEEDWAGFSEITSLIGDRVWIVGDDLLTTNIVRIKKAHELNAANAVLIKPNQIGTITETIQAVNLAKSYGWKIIVSHRSGETFDTFIADLAAGVGADGLKSGCPLQRERLIKYERLVEIEKIWHI